jgi:hypothetical protein
MGGGAVSRGRSSTTGRVERGSVSKPASRSSIPRTAAPGEATGWDALQLDESDFDVDPAELQEFLAGDLLDVQADPVFKERLRQKLWRLVRVRYGGGRDGD